MFISSQLNVLYPKALISEILEGKGIDFDIVCPKTESQNIQTLVGALGSYLWDAMPEIRKKFGFNIIYPEEINLFKSLYGDSHPLLK